MKLRYHVIKTIAGAAVSLLLFASVASAQDKVTPDEAKEQLAYSIGVQAYFYSVTTIWKILLK